MQLVFWWMNILHFIGNVMVATLVIYGVVTIVTFLVFLLVSLFWSCSSIVVYCKLTWNMYSNLGFLVYNYMYLSRLFANITVQRGKICVFARRYISEKSAWGWGYMYLYIPHGAFEPWSSGPRYHGLTDWSLLLHSLQVRIENHPVRFFVHKRPHVDFFLAVVSPVLSELQTFTSFWPTVGCCFELWNAHTQSNPFYHFFYATHTRLWEL